MQEIKSKGNFREKIRMFFKDEEEEEIEKIVSEFRESLNKTNKKMNREQYQHILISGLESLTNIYKRKIENQKGFITFLIFLVIIVNAIYLKVDLVTGIINVICNILYILLEIQKGQKKNKGAKIALSYLEDRKLEEIKKLEELEQNKKIEEQKIVVLKRTLEGQIEKEENYAKLQYDYIFFAKQILLHNKIGILKFYLKKKGYTEEDCDKIENWLAYDKFKEEENSLLRKIER